MVRGAAPHSPGARGAFGGVLGWERLKDKRACRIAVHRQNPVRLDDETDTAHAVSWAADQAVRFVSVLDQRLRSERTNRLNPPSGPHDDTSTEET